MLSTKWWEGSKEESNLGNEAGKRCLVKESSRSTQSKGTGQGSAWAAGSWEMSVRSTGLSVVSLPLLKQFFEV